MSQNRLAASLLGVALPMDRMNAELLVAFAAPWQQDPTVRVLAATTLGGMGEVAHAHARDLVGLLKDCCFLDLPTCSP